MYEYNCKLVKVVDGDTIDIDIDLGFDTILKNQRVRLAGIDTPESRTRDAEEKKYGFAAKKFLQEYLWKMNPNHDLILRTTEYDAKGKFGRILGEVFNLYGSQPIKQKEPSVSANQALIENHHAVAYHGESKEDIEAGHLLNREFVDLEEITND